MTTMRMFKQILSWHHCDCTSLRHFFLSLIKGVPPEMLESKVKKKTNPYNSNKNFGQNFPISYII